MKTLIEAIDLFCGIGGLTYGLQEAGIKVKAGLDCDLSCKTIYEKNNNCEFIHADITNYNFEELKTYYSSHSVKVLVGCAPCQPFSSHSFKYSNKEQDQRWSLIDYFKMGVSVIEPDYISVENVRGFAKTDIFTNFVADLKEMGYYVKYDIMYCPEFGVPQNRYRMVLLASKNSEFSLPNKSYSKSDFPTVADFIKDLPAIQAGENDNSDPLHKSKNLSSKNLIRIKKSTPGGTWKDWNRDLLPNCYLKDSGSTYTSVYGRMKWDAVAPTITTQFYNYGSGRFGHPTQHRALSLREGALLQTFPMNYDFGEVISIARTGKHIGNAVPPKLGEAIGKKITEVVNGQK